MDQSTHLGNHTHNSLCQHFHKSYVLNNYHDKTIARVHTQAVLSLTLSPPSLPPSLSLSLTLNMLLLLTRTVKCWISTIDDTWWIRRRVILCGRLKARGVVIWAGLEHILANTDTGKKAFWRPTHAGTGNVRGDAIISGVGVEH